ncbi:MAG: ATP-dependent helicase PcrA, partial [Planctomycetota bacterium]
DAEVRARWQSRFSHILVDEYQDTNHVQYRLIRALGEHRNVCATGDPDQAIYGWRGADYENILRFEEDFKPCTKVLLETNYRSTKTILLAAQKVVENNQKRMEKTIRTDNPQGKPITVLAVDDETDESWAVAAAVERMLERGGRRPADVAIFYRTNAQSRYLEDGLRRRGIAYRIVGGTRFYDREEVRHVLAYLRVLANPADRTSFLRVVNVPARGVGEKTVDLLMELCDDEGVGPVEALLREDLLERVAVGRAATALRGLARTWAMLRTLPLGNPPACVRGVIEMTRMKEHYLKSEEPAKAQERADNIDEVISAAEAYLESYPSEGLPGFLDQAALNADEKRDDAGAERVTLMTLHAAKGLEFPVVFITACEEGILPLMRKNECADLEEERRLMYVGITRAREELYLSRSRCRFMYGQTFRNEPSRFLGEMPADCFESKDRTTARSEPAGGFSMERALASGLLTKGSALRRRGGEPAEDPDDDEGLAHESAAAKGAATRRRNAAIARAADAAQVLDDDPWRPGDAIIHAIYGRGSVVAMKGPAGDRSVVIDFASADRREMVLAMAAGKLSRG